LGLGRLIDGPAIAGDRFLAPSPSGWRAEVLMALVIEPTLEGQGAPTAELGFDQRDVVRLFPKRRLIKSMALMRPLPDDDAMELGRQIPDLRKPIDIVEDYLKWLWIQGILRARPGLVEAIPAGAIVESCAFSGCAPDWSISQDVVENILDRAKVQSET
ncbi:hypothetical protein ACOI1H_25970, partial [Loktanella sp. DJP18]|uniref:hypothetical protein n=1 Tax=Loktanella sp. DJP18 TaxID=3409788 RepID=UPI003BB80CBA